MKTYPFLLIFLFVSASWQVRAQAPAQSKPGTHINNDTVTVRLNSKLYYTLTDNGHWRVNGDNKVVFSTLNPNDTSPDIALDYIASKPSLVRQLRKGDTIQNCLVGDIKLSFSDFMDASQKKNGLHNVCSRNLIFFNCVFSRVLADTAVQLLEDDSKEKKKMDFKQDIIFVDCSFPRGLEMSDCIFEKKFILNGQITANSTSSIDNCEFHDMCYIYSTPDYNGGNSYLKMNSCVFNHTCVFAVSDNEKTHILIQRCKFNDVFSLGKSVPISIFKRGHSVSAGTNIVKRADTYYTDYANFLKNKYTHEYYITDDSIEAFMPVTRVIYNVAMVRCKARVIDVANASMLDCSLEDVSVLKCIDVTGSAFAYSSTFAGKEALGDLNFPNNNCVIYASYKTFSPEANNLNIYLEKVLIHPLVHNYFDSTADFEQDNSNFYNMIKDYAAKKFTDAGFVTTIKARYEHERAQWDRSYHWAHVAHARGVGDFIGSFFQWALSYFLEVTVSTGYQGEWKFFLWVIFLILMFSTIYYFRHKEAVIDYLNLSFNKDEDKIKSYETLKVYKSFNGARDFMRCLWFSCMVFVDPRLPISFFNLRMGLFGLVLAEWLCGLTAIALFVVFLASNYPFIHTLIGI